MGLFDLFKNKKLCLDAYNKGDLAVIGGAINVMCQKKKTKDAVAILKYIAQKITITNDKEFGRAKELRKFWKKINPSSYKKDGLILKNKYKDYFNKHLIKQAEICTKLLNIGQTEVLQLRFKDFYEIDRNLGRAILKYMALNASCEGLKAYKAMCDIIEYIREDLNDYQWVDSLRENVVGNVLRKKGSKIPVKKMRVILLKLREKLITLNLQNRCGPRLWSIFQNQKAIDITLDLAVDGFTQGNAVNIHGVHFCGNFLTTLVASVMGAIEAISDESNSSDESNNCKELKNYFDSINNCCKSQFGVDFDALRQGGDGVYPKIATFLDKVPVDEVVNRLIKLTNLMWQCNKLL